MTIVLQIQIYIYMSWEYLYKKNHSYTDMTIDLIWIQRDCVRPSITFARDSWRGQSLESIYEDDQMVMFIVEYFLPFKYLKKHAT